MVVFSKPLADVGRRTVQGAASNATQASADRKSAADEDVRKGLRARLAQIRLGQSASSGDVLASRLGLAHVSGRTVRRPVCCSRATPSPPALARTPSPPFPPLLPPLRLTARHPLAPPSRCPAAPQADQGDERGHGRRWGRRGGAPRCRRGLHRRLHAFSAMTMSLEGRGWSGLNPSRRRAASLIRG